MDGFNERFNDLRGTFNERFADAARANDAAHATINQTVAQLRDGLRASGEA